MFGRNKQGPESSFEERLATAGSAFDAAVGAAATFDPTQLAESYDALQLVVTEARSEGKLTAELALGKMATVAAQAAQAAETAGSTDLASSYSGKAETFKISLAMLTATPAPKQAPTPTRDRKMGSGKR